MNRRIVLVVLGVLVLAGVIYFFPAILKFFARENFSTCFAKHGMVPGIFPEKCVTPEGKEFTNNLAPKNVETGIDQEAFKPEVAIFTDLKAPIASPYVLTFAAKQSWVQGRAVTVALRAGDEKIVSAVAEPQPGGGAGYQNFSATLTFAKVPSTEAGTLSFVLGGGSPIDMSVTFK